MSGSSPARRELGTAVFAGSDGKQHALPTWSLFCFGPRSWVRNRCILLMTHPNFDSAVLVLIAYSSALLAVTDYSHIYLDGPNLGLPRAEGSLRNTVAERSDFYVCTPLFLLELVVRVISMSFCSGPRSYIRNPWNCLDFVVVVSGAFEYLTMLAVPLPSLSGLRVLRVLRPLRSLKSSPRLSRLAFSMLSALPQLGSVMVLLGFIFLIFGIVGVELRSPEVLSR